MRDPTQAIRRYSTIAAAQVPGQQPHQHTTAITCRLLPYGVHHQQSHQLPTVPSHPPQPSSRVPNKRRRCPRCPEPALQSCRLRHPRHREKLLLHLNESTNASSATELSAEVNTEVVMNAHVRIPLFLALIFFPPFSWLKKKKFPPPTMGPLPSPSGYPPFREIPFSSFLVID